METNTDNKQKMKRSLEGIVTKKGSAQTITVRVERKQQHPIYGKVLRSHKNYLVHCPDLDAVEVGDRVTITESRPFSKMKSWQITK